MKTFNIKNCWLSHLEDILFVGDVDLDVNYRTAKPEYSFSVNYRGTVGSVSPTFETEAEAIAAREELLGVLKGLHG